MSTPLTSPTLRAWDHTTLSDSGCAVEDGRASKAEPASAALIAVANSYSNFPRHVVGLTPCRQLLQCPDHLGFRVPVFRHTLFPFLSLKSYSASS